jgi:hypothetical protein
MIKTDCSNYRAISLSPITYKLLSNTLMSKLNSYAEEIIGDHQCGCDATGQLLIIHTSFVKYLKIIGNTMKQ